MPTYEHGGQQLHYLDYGDPQAPIVVLQHGLLIAARYWAELGYVAALQDAFRVLAPDSIGHGGSPDPRTPEECGRETRAAAVLALADAVGAARFHYIGYSMGGWIGGAIARTAPARLLSLSFGGWDIDSGFRTAKEWTREHFARDLDADLLIRMFPGSDAEAPARVSGWRDTVHRLDAPPHDVEVVGALAVPVQLWCGDADPYHERMRESATALGARFDSIPGDHLTAMAHPAAPAAVAAFLASATG